MSETEPVKIITENGKESATRSAMYWLLRRPSFSAYLMQYAANYERLIKEAIDQFAIITESQILDQFFPNLHDGLQFAKDNLGGQSGIVYPVKRLGIPSSKIYVQSTPIAFLVHGNVPKFTGISALPMETDININSFLSKFKRKSSITPSHSNIN